MVRGVNGNLRASGCGPHRRFEELQDEGQSHPELVHAGGSSPQGC